MTAVLLIFVLYPTLVRFSTQILKCVEIDGDTFLIADLQEPCYRGRHLQFVLYLGLPETILWVVGLPCAAVIALSHHRRREAKIRKRLRGPCVCAEQETCTCKLQIHHNLDVMLDRSSFRYGILYRGYRSKFWWWEVVLAFRKVAISVLVVLSGVIDKEQQILFACYLVFLCLILHLMATPFTAIGPTGKKVALHKMEFGRSWYASLHFGQATCSMTRRMPICKLVADSHHYCL